MPLKEEIRIKGMPICSGIAIGHAFLFLYDEETVPEFIIRSEEITNEIGRYRSALSKSKREIEHLQNQLKSDGVDEGVLILDTHLQIMHDDLITGYLENQIRSTQKNAEFVFQVVMNDYEKQFKQVSDQMFKERIKDIQDIYKRIMRNLKKSAKISLADIPKNSIVFASDLAPSEAAEANQLRVKAFVTEFGGETSHAAIIARSKGIPYVSCVNMRDYVFEKDQMVIVDGRIGEVILNPSDETLALYEKLQAQLENHLNQLSKKGSLKPETIDGYRIKLSVNLEDQSEIEELHRFGADGVGLFRSEYICLKDGKFPSESKQEKLYSDLVKALKGSTLTLRTFDIGGDKGQHFLPYEEPNPFLGCRAIRYLLKYPDIFQTQLRAILKASAYGPIRLLLPMVSEVHELLEAKEHLKCAQRDLENQGIAFAQEIQLGCMIEVPSAAITCDELAKHCDFLSIGTNDLVQYSLAVDRGNQEMSYLYNPAQPSVIRFIKMIVMEANHYGISVSICGEVAADPRYTALLLGLGVHELSCSMRFLPIVKNAIRQTKIISACQLADDILRMSTAKEVLDRLNQEYQKQVPTDVLHNVSN